MGFGFSNIICTGMTLWTPTYLIRVFHWKAAQAGAYLGAVVLVGGVFAQMGGAMIVDRLYARGHRDAHLRFHMIVMG